MPEHDFRSPRLFLDQPLAEGRELELDADQANHLANVLRLRAGDIVLLFNGRDGEWQGVAGGKRLRSVVVGRQTRQQTPSGNLHLLFAPLKHARLDYMIQKAVEMGASRLSPILTQHTQVARVNVERVRANAIAAAEQCGVLALPEITEPVPFEKIVFEPERRYIFCDERAEVKDPVAALSAVRAGDNPPLAVLIGPEGGFAEAERESLIRRGNVVRIALGPRILRADTAAVAALATVQAVLGDWRRG